MSKNKWYIVNVQAGKEDLVARKINLAVESMGLKSLISDVLIPKQSKIFIGKDGKKSVKKQNMLKGYVIVQMEYNEKTAPIIVNIEEVRGFVKVENNVFPLSDEEVERLARPNGSAKTKESKNETKFIPCFAVNDAVKVSSGVFKGFIGKVTNVDSRRGKVTVLITMLGQETPYELGIDEVEKL